MTKESAAMPNDDIINIADTLVAEMRSFVERRVAESQKAFEEKVAQAVVRANEAEVRAAEAEQKVLACMAAMPSVKDGRDGVDGKDATVDYAVIRADLEKMVAASVAAIPVPERGPPGENGKGADAEAIKGDVIAHTQTVIREMFKAIPPPRDGIDGKDGRDGQDGKDADAEEIKGEVIAHTQTVIREMFKEIPRPRDGIDGQDGQDGQDGKDGDPGRDAAQLDIVKNFDDTRRYARGTWAQIGGGLWRSGRSTDPAAGAKSLPDAGWDCMVAGIGEISGQFDAETRTLRLDIETGGGVKQVSFDVPMMIYRGAHELGREYKAGDVVASDGSGWISNRPTKEIPGASPDWNLIAKKGRDFRPMDRNAPRDDAPIKLR